MRAPHRPGIRRRTIRGRPDSLARTGSNLYVTVRYSGYVRRSEQQKDQCWRDHSTDGCAQWQRSGLVSSRAGPR